MSLSKKKVSKNDYVEMFIELTNDFFEAGQSITGEVVLNVKQQFPADALKVKVKGAERVHWTDMEKTYDIVQKDGKEEKVPKIISVERKSKCKIFEVTVTLFKVDSGFFIPGYYQFPFIIPTNLNFPGTFYIESPLSDPCQLKMAKIEYTVGSTLESSDQGIKDLKFKGEFVIRQSLPPLLLKDKPTNLAFEVTKCLCCGKGKGQLSAYIEKNNYALNEEIQVLMMADNTNSNVPIVGLSAKLYQIITLKAGTYKKEFSNEVGGGIQSISIPKGEQMASPATIKLKVNKNAYRFKAKNYSEDVMNHATAEGKLVTCKYEVLLTPAYEGCCVQGGVITFDVNLFAQPIETPKYEFPSSITPQHYEQVAIQVPAFANMIVMS